MTFKEVEYAALHPESSKSRLDAVFEEYCLDQQIQNKRCFLQKRILSVYPIRSNGNIFSYFAQHLKKAQEEQTFELLRILQRRKTEIKKQNGKVKNA